MYVFRLCRKEHVALDGEGARLHGGRWNNIGTPVIYTANSLALAILETRVNQIRFPKGYVYMRIRIPDDFTSLVDTMSLPEFGGWRNTVGLTRRFVDVYAVMGPEARPLKVPSVVVPGDFDFNVLIFPEYAKQHAVVEETQEIDFDPRLWTVDPLESARRP